MQAIARHVVAALVLAAIQDLGGNLIYDVGRDVMCVDVLPVVADSAVVVLDLADADGHVVLRCDCVKSTVSTRGSQARIKRFSSFSV